jgi:hypothetical protein
MTLRSYFPQSLSDILPAKRHPGEGFERTAPPWPTSRPTLVGFENALVETIERHPCFARLWE